MKILGKRRNIIYLKLLFSIMMLAHQSSSMPTNPSRCRTVSDTTLRTFTGVINDPMKFDLMLKCHSNTQELRISAYFRINENPPAGRKGYIVLLVNKIHLYIKEGATAADTELVLEMNDSVTFPDPVIFPVQRHKWILVVVEIDGLNLVVTMKDDPTDYGAQGANIITKTGYLSKNSLQITRF